MKALRRSSDTLLPLSPFLDDWGSVVAQQEESPEVLAALVMGCKRVQGQQGYYRAIAGMLAASASAFERTASRMPSSARELCCGRGRNAQADLPSRAFPSNP